MSATIEISSSAIVAVGNFNPPIFTPDWLERNKLIGEDDAEGARKDPGLVISPQVTRFETELFALQVLERQFALTSKGPLHPMLKDLAIGIFTLLPQTPITALGLNFQAHYKLSDEADYHKIGDILAPKEIWRSLFPGENESVGLMSLTMGVDPYKRDDKGKKIGDRKSFTVQPSGKVPRGVFFAVNDHHQIDDERRGKDVTSAEYAVKITDTLWQKTWDESMHVFASIIEQCLAK